MSDSDDSSCDPSEAFDLFDKDRNKEISIDEMVSIMKTLGHNIPVKDIKDKMKNDTIKREDFIEIISKQETEKAEEVDLLEAFKVFDRDGNGIISSEEFKFVMESLGETIPEDELKEMVKKASSEGNDKVTLKDFVTLYLVNNFNICFIKNIII
jgi:calmodulin